MAADDVLKHLRVTPADIGRRSKCPRCKYVGVIDDIAPNGDVIIRHSAESWHVSSFDEACSLLWPERFLL